MFLDASSNLYKRVCLFVRLFIGLPVGPLVHDATGKILL